MNFMNKIIYPKYNSLRATSFIMSDERKKRVKVVLGGECSRHVADSGGAQESGVPFTDQFPPTSPFYMKLLVMKRREDEWKARVRRLTTS